MRQALIVVEPYGKRLVVRKGVKLLDALLTNGVPVRSDCGGFGACGKCKVIVREGNRFNKAKIPAKISLRNLSPLNTIHSPISFFYSSLRFLGIFSFSQ